MSLVGELNDNCFVVAGAGLKDLVEAFTEEMGRGPTADELAELLSWGVRSLEGLSGDPDVSQATVVIKIAKRKHPRPEPGDVFAIPKGDEAFLVIYLGRFGRFGSGFGLCKGKHPIRAIDQGWKPKEIIRQPVFCEEDAIAAGRWRLLGKKPDLEQLFGTPEIFHSTRNFPDDPRFAGAHGLAEAPDGTLRPVQEVEAREIGLLDRSYRMMFSSQELEAKLEKWCL